MVRILKLQRTTARSFITALTLLFTVIIIFTTFRLYQKDKLLKQSSQFIRNGAEKPSLVALPDQRTEQSPATATGTKRVSAKNENIFAKYASEEHLLSLLQKQSNSLGQVVITIIGGDSYSLFAWDWYERMLEVSGDAKNCHCFVVAMDEIGVVLSVKQGVPVYYSTFSFEHQMRWINTVEARQHSLYRVGHAKFDTSAKIVRLGYSVVLSEMDVFWRKDPLTTLKAPLDSYDLQISHHYGSHPRVNIGLFFVRSTNSSIIFFSHVAEFWIRYGKGGYLSDQRVLDALLKNYDRLDKTYLKAMKPLPSIIFNWTTHDFGNYYSHMMTDGNAFILFEQAAKLDRRSKKFYGEVQPKFFTVTVTDENMPVSRRNLLVRSLLILQHTELQNRTLILPAFTPNSTRVPIQYQLDIKKFLIYWTEERIRLPNFLSLTRISSMTTTNVPYVAKKTYEDVNGILNFTLESIPLNLPAPSAQFEAQVRDSLLWCSPPMAGGAWCMHHPRDFAATMEILFACRGDPYPPCANKTEKNEQFLERPYETE